MPLSTMQPAPLDLESLVRSGSTPMLALEWCWSSPRPSYGSRSRSRRGTWRAGAAPSTARRAAARVGVRDRVLSGSHADRPDDRRRRRRPVVRRSFGSLGPASRGRAAARGASGVRRRRLDRRVRLAGTAAADLGRRARRLAGGRGCVHARLLRAPRRHATGLRRAARAPFAARGGRSLGSRCEPHQPRRRTGHRSRVLARRSPRRVLLHAPLGRRPRPVRHAHRWSSTAQDRRRHGRHVALVEARRRSAYCTRVQRPSQYANRKSAEDGKSSPSPSPLTR